MIRVAPLLSFRSWDVPQLQAQMWVSASERKTGSLEVDFTSSTQIIHLLSNTLDSSSVDVCGLSCVQLFATQWTEARQAPLSVGSPR